MAILMEEDHTKSEPRPFGEDNATYFDKLSQAACPVCRSPMHARYGK